jgi:hypothetical protein
MREIILKVHGKEYTSLKSWELYKTTGGASDWFYSEQVVEAFGRHVYSYTIELRPRDGGANGFLLPPSQIIAVGEEIFPAFIHFVEVATSNTLD